MSLGPRYYFELAMMVAVLALGSAHASAQGYADFPYSIMAPERGAIHRHHQGRVRAAHVSTKSAHARRKPHVRKNPVMARGSSGVVLPTPLPRTPLIPPEGNSAAVFRSAPPQQQGLTIVPDAPGLPPVPNLPHGSETFQDRASRCAFQQGLYNVPGNLTTQYMGACVQ